MALFASSSDMFDTFGTIAAVAVGEGVSLGCLDPGRPEASMPMTMPAKMRRRMMSIHTHQRRRGRLSSAVCSGADGWVEMGGAGGAGEGAVAEGMAVVLCQVSVAGADTAMPRAAARSSVRI